MTINKQEILDAFGFRHACKEFDAERKIDADDFEFILEIARLSPSSFGLEPWQFLVVQNPDLREKLRQYTWGGQKQLPTASHVVLTLVRKSYFMRYDSEYLYRLMREVQKFPEDQAKTRTAVIEKFQRSDFNLLESERAITDWATRQTYLPLANMMTAAAMIGIDSCPIEGFERTDLERVLAEAADVNLEHWSVAYLLAFGYRKNPPARPKTRQERDAVVRWLD
ncbi:NAD(P)H-dependent oxidoreductase [Methylomonas montana]|uniref:NAD(P)H-dependent oxidoreductase n=1 Tax=Methylomonas montana TaxID=3058963 RepID=UPI002658276D|nr:NAD(P)H-dependent oxidoreductase [Methylomonas montana]WKJ90666.1 NAD(P)H-dependent oxidoreductase [Methylomonas montana]